MWTKVACIVALGLAPAQASALDITHVRTTYGVLGQARPDTKFLPGDNFVLSFDLEGLQVSDKGKFLYQIAMEVVDAQGTVRFKQAPRDLEANNPLGGNSLPAFADLKIGVDQPPGKHTMKVTVTDRVGKATKALSRSFEVLPKGFGLVRLKLTGDPEGTTPVAIAAEGQLLWVNFAAVGFGRGNGMGQPNLSVELRVLDDNGRPTTDRPLTGAVTKDVAPKMRAVPMQFLLELNRAGKFTIEVKAMDKVSGKTAALSFPLTVLKPQ